LATTQKTRDDGSISGAENRWYCERTCAHNKIFGPTGRPLHAPVEHDFPAASPRAEATRQKSMSADPTPTVTALAGILTIKAQSGFEHAFLDHFRRVSADDDSACGRALRSGERIIIKDVETDPPYAALRPVARNPLAPIRYALGAAKKAGRTPEQAQRVEEIIERQVSHMSRLLDDLLDILRITRGTLGLQKSRTELTAVIATAIEAARPVLDTKRHALSVDLPKEPVRIEADTVRLAQVFSNLLINAAKYTDPGGRIELSAAQDGGDILLRVRDDGIGISAEMMPRLFTMFSQAEGALTRGLVELHGGTITARSEGIDRGSEFLKPCGHHVRIAHSGPSALAIAQEFRPHVAILDIGMPDMDGYELAQRLRATAWAARSSRCFSSSPPAFEQKKGAIHGDS
jgi:two-component sensor histidine kinase